MGFKMAEVDSLIVSDEIDRYGSTVVIRSYAKTYSDYGDEILGTATLSTTVAVINALTSDIIMQAEGEFTQKDKRMFFKPDETIEPDYQVIHDTVVYKVTEVLKHELQDTEYAIEAMCKRVS
jgi:hypothetical protein